MKDIESMITAASARTARDITKDLEEKHRQEMQGQQDVMRQLEKAMQALQVSQLTKSLDKDTQASPFETPRATRPQNLAYQQILTSSKAAKVREATTDTTRRVLSTEEKSTDTTLEMLVKMMAATVKSTNDKDTTTDLPKFSGQDAQWERWHELLRSYFQARGWLTTFDHPIGPGTPDNLTPGFDNEINEKIYQKIQSKCYEGTASTYVRMAAEFDGHGVGLRLRARYHGYSHRS
jgi:hypothetical protein